MNKAQRLYSLVGVFALVCAVYAVLLNYEFVRWDDAMLIYENPAIRGITPWTLWWVFTHFDPELYIPFTFISYQLNYLVGGVHPFIYHFTNILLHALNAVLLVRVVEKLTGRFRLALLCGLLFAIHPLHTEAVAWASGRKDVLSGAFYLAAFSAYLSYQDDGSKKLYYWSIAFHLFGLFSKVMTATLPAVLLLESVLLRKKSWKESILPLLPHFALSFVFALVGFLGKEQLVGATSVFEKMMMACVSTMFYLKQMLWPQTFSLLYPFVGDISITRVDVALPVVLTIVLLATAFACWKKFPAVAFCILAYIGTLAPTFLNFSKGSDLDVYFASDRYAYLPSLFVFLLIGAGIDRLSDRISKYVFVSVATVLTVTLSVLAFHQSHVWKDTRALFTHVIAVYPQASHVAHNNLGNMERLEGNLEKAEQEFREALAIRPHAKTWSNLGAVQRLEGKLSDAHVSYAEALKLDPESGYTHLGMGLVLQQEGKLDEAKVEYQKSLELDATIEEAPANLGAILMQQGKTQEAISSYEQALRINPFKVQIYYNLGIAYTKLQNAEKAIAAYKEAIRLEPTLLPPRINLGLLLAQIRDTAGARKQFEEILKIDPQNAIARSALSQLGTTR